MRLYRYRSGTVILWAMLMTAAIMTVGVALATVVIGSLKTSQELDESMVAFYGADSCIEDSLWRVLQGDLKLNPSTPVTKQIQANALRGSSDPSASMVSTTLTPNPFITARVNWQRKTDCTSADLTCTSPTTPLVIKCVGKFGSSTQGVQVSL